MELTKANENYFDPTPKLKSSPIPINFIPFNKNDYCFYCKNKYTTTWARQKYCENCLSQYINNIDGDNTYLAVLIGTRQSGSCQEHAKIRNKMLTTCNIKEWCKNCSLILCFNQTFAGYMHDYSYYSYEYTPKENCTLCGKIIYQTIPTKVKEFRLCSDCYLISSGWIDSLNEKPIPVLYLPWWDNSDQCLVCNKYLDFISECQKWCTRCCNIVYSGCRYCLTTNIIFGLSDQSQCRKCKRILVISIDIKNITSGNSDIDALIRDTRFKIKNDHKIINDISSIDITNPLNVYNFIRSNYTPSYALMEWISYSKITNLKKLAEGGFSIIYEAYWSGEHKNIAVKQLKSSEKISKEFLNELKSYNKCCTEFGHVIQCYGITKDPNTDEYMLIMDYARKGNLHDYLQKNFININWRTKIDILRQISNGLGNIHNANFIHRDLHSGNILIGVIGSYSREYRIGDMGLSQPASETSSNNEIYGVIPYVAPEIFNGAKFSKASDVYSLGMIMWECTTGCKPFADVEHDIELIYNIMDGKRPEITKDTPECFVNLMKRCWEFDPTKRPSINEVVDAFFNWDWCKANAVQFKQAEKKRLELIQLKLLGPNFTVKHPGAIFTSRSLRSFISKASSVNSTSSFSFNEYISKEYDLDINKLQRSLTNISSTIESSNIQHPGAIYTSRSLNALISTVNVSRKHKIEELNNKTQDSDKRNKTDKNQ
ncbi:kinase-like domain-containing protein [Glomus cerebriforme]|uniref:Kinase-like domain-containing protein n=1 Tax=Glomus cerebriforme TaxID=658196 RepID=A0A397TFE1_9GLOM|nr:kinase-like domain-containing protein [Glomus cerebriforme]